MTSLLITAAGATFWLWLLQLEQDGKLSWVATRWVSTIFQQMLFALAQWRILRGTVHHASLWIPATIVPTLGLTAFWFIGDTGQVFDPTEFGPVLISLNGFFYGFVEALPLSIVLTNLLRHPRA